MLAIKWVNWSITKLLVIYNATYMYIYNSCHYMYSHIVVPCAIIQLLTIVWLMQILISSTILYSQSIFLKMSPELFVKLLAKMLWLFGAVKLHWVVTLKMNECDGSQVSINVWFSMKISNMRLKVFRNCGPSITLLLLF